jgi:uncharacterized protein
MNALANSIADKEAALIEILQQLDSVIVAYSGGVDSSLLAYYARRVLGTAARIVIAVSPSLAVDELHDARAQAELFNFDLIEIKTDEVDSEEYRANDSMRCYFCKSTLFAVLANMQMELQISAIAYGANQDDLNDYRPGHQAAKQYGVVAPLLDAGMTKEDIRILAERACLPSWNRPQAACLSSRFAQLTYITPSRLALIDKLEQAVRGFDFRQVRVRYLSEDDSARVSIEVGTDEVFRLNDNERLRGELQDKIRAIAAADNARLTQVSIDPQGYAQGKSLAKVENKG